MLGASMNIASHRRSLLILLILTCCSHLHGIDRDHRLADLYHTAWTFKDGAPAEIHALAQTTDGFLWLGTATGLFRFDGIRFEAYKPQSGQAFPQRNVVSLFAVPDGGLWVGYWYGGVSFIKNGTVTDYGEPEGLPSHAVLAFAGDRQGAIWIAAGNDGLARLEGSRWRKIGTDWGFAGPANTVFVDHAGTVWVGTPTSVAYLMEGSTKFQIAAQGLRRVNNLAESSDGTLWMAETSYGVRPVPLLWKNNGRSEPTIFVGSQAIAFDNHGSLWITTLGSGIRRVPYPERLHQSQTPGPSAWQFHSSEVEALTEQDGLTSDYINCVLQDREGNVWIGATGGLDQFRQSPVISILVEPISYPGALPIPSLHSFTTSALAAGDQGALWAAGMGPQVLLKIQKGRIATQLRDRNIDCAYRDPTGVVWLATSWSIFRLADERLHTIRSKQGTVTYKYDVTAPAGRGQTLRRLELPKAAGIAVSLQSRVKAITQDRLGRLWISLMELGTFRLEGSSWTSLGNLGGPQRTATAEFTDSEGRIWFGFANAVAILDGERVRIFSGKDGVQIGAVTSIHAKGNTIWIGGEFGLEFFDGSRFHPINPADGTAFSGTSGIVADPEDGLWFSEKRGIIHIHDAQLQQLGSGKVEFDSYGLLDGLTAELRGPLASPSTVQTTDGRIWFATTKGVAWITPNPKRIVRNTVPPGVSIESVIANGRKYDSSTFLKLPPRIENLEIAFTATSLTIPERVRFRYKLEGQDKDWQQAGTRRETVYTNLDTGSYTFRVIACNNDGVWNEAGASLEFFVRPAYYQTAWFRILCIAVFFGLLWALYQLRIRQLQQKFAMVVEVRVDERTRIARELHDTVLQSLHGLLMSFQRAANLLPDRPIESKQRLEGAIDQAAKAITEGREAVQGLRSSTVITNDLAVAIRTLGEELATQQTNQDAPLFEVAVEGTPRDLNPILRDDVYRIAGEALRNAFHHAQARRIEVEIQYDKSHLRLRVRDDGKGVDSEIFTEGRSGHWGLQGMRERAKLLGGQLEVWSELDSGTEIQLIVPASIAYLTPRQTRNRTAMDL
jgi:signal transduction histidine kinase/ligand-binding sensor domain-containing protein